MWLAEDFGRARKKGCCLKRPDSMFEAEDQEAAGGTCYLKNLNPHAKHAVLDYLLAKLEVFMMRGRGQFLLVLG